MLQQPLNNLAPFKVSDTNEEPIIQVDEDGVKVQTLYFPDGSFMRSAGVVTIALPNPIDLGTF